MRKIKLDRNVDVTNVEVIKYVEKKKSDIYSRPNLDRQSLVKLMYDNVL